MAKMLNLLEIGINKLSPKSTKEKEKKRKTSIYPKKNSIGSIGQPRRMEGFPFKGNVCNWIININPSNWLKGSQLTYMANKLMNFVVLAKQRVKVNRFAIVFNNFYNRLQNLFVSTKLDVNRDIIEFGAIQAIDILL